MKAQFEVLSDARWIGCHGIGRFAREVLSRLPAHHQLTGGPKPLSPADPFWLSMRTLASPHAVFFSPGFNPPPFSRTPFVFTIHDLIHIESEEEASAAKRLYYEFLLKPACRRAHRVLTVSEYSRSRIVKWSGIPEELVVNVGNGVGAPFVVNGPRYAPGISYILYAGNARPHKNLRRLFTAFRHLARPDLRLVLAGCSRSAVFPLLEHAGIADRAEVIPSPTDDELASLYRGASLAVVPSLIEGFGLTALEAMACGVPVVASKAASIPEVVGDAALLVDPLDPQAIAQAVHWLLTQPGVRDSMIVRGVERAREFSWARVAAKVRSVLEDVIEMATHLRIQS
jgi:glycosyltransferase involved in cell wall biosynthesis